MSDRLIELMATIRAPVRRDWKEMRRAFRVRLMISCHVLDLVSSEWWRDKHSVRKIFTSVFEEATSTQTEWKHNLTFVLLSEGGKNLSEYKIRNYSTESPLYCIYAIVFVSENSYVNTVRAHFPLSNLYILFQSLVEERQFSSLIVFYLFKFMER